MRTAVLLARVRDTCPIFATVDHALAPAADFLRPAALITPLKLAPQAPGLLGRHSQMTDWTFGIYVIVDRVTDGVAATTADQLDDCVAQLRAALNGWVQDPDPDAMSPLAYAGGMIDRYRDGIVCWREDFATTIEMRGTP